MGDAPKSIDMTKAKTLEPVPADQAYLIAVSKWEYGTSQASGGASLNYELTVVKPEAFAGRKIPASLSLVNEFTLGTYQGMLKALGFPAEMVDSPKHVPPKTDDVVGMQATAWFGIRKSDEFGDRNQLRRMRPAEAFETIGE